MAKTIVGSFASFDEARRVVHELEALGIAHGATSLTASNTTGEHAHGLIESTETEPDGVAADATRGAIAGGMVGGVTGLIAGLIGVTIPGIGPLVAAGPIVAALSGAGVGIVAGGLVGGLRHIGVPHADAEHYAESVRRGGALVTVHADDAHAQQVAELMRRHGAVDVDRERADRQALGASGDTSRPTTGDTLPGYRADATSAAARAADLADDVPPGMNRNLP